MKLFFNKSKIKLNYAVINRIHIKGNKKGRKLSVSHRLWNIFEHYGKQLQ